MRRPAISILRFVLTIALAACFGLPGPTRAYAQSPAVQPLGTPGPGDTVVPPPPPPPADIPPPAPVSDFTLPTRPSGVPQLNIDVPSVLKPTGDAMPTPRSPQPKSSRQYNGLIALLVNPEFGNFPVVGNYELSWRPPAAVSGQPSDLAFVRNAFNVLFPIMEAENDEIAGSIQFRNESFYNTNVLLPDSNRELPHQLWDFRFGLGYRHRFDNGWIAGGNVVTGSVADRPFYSYREWYFAVNGYLAIPRQGTNDAWLFALLYNNLSPVNYPLPSIAYLYRPSENFHASIGLPFTVMWKPEERLTLDFSYVPIRTVRAQVQYMIALPLRAYAAYEWDNESYFLANRASYFDKLQYYEMRLSAGTRLFLSAHFGFDLQAGYAFDRYYFQGRDYSDRRQDRIDVGAGPYLALQALFIW
ncbi:MAG: hypothetical protein K2X38_04565 [Gemmataceae bacterium]|nr:hypothetical protein [Gemmataceae bacterium]